MDKKILRDRLKLYSSFLFLFLYIPHLVLYLLSVGGCRYYIEGDLKRMSEREYIKINGVVALLFFLHNDRYFRSLFYYRIGPILSALISWWKSGDRYFTISKTLKMGKGCVIAHPYATILNADEIGENFDCRHCTTLGAKGKGRPRIGDNVTLGANVTIIGPVHIGNNVIIGAGAVVVKDVPDNCIAAGNPARVIRYVEPVYKN